MEHENNILINARLKAAFQRNLGSRTKKEIAEKIGISNTSLQAYIATNNPKQPSLSTAIALAKELNVSLDWLCGLSNTTDTETQPPTTYKELAQLLYSLLGTKTEFATELITYEKIIDLNHSQEIPCGVSFKSIASDSFESFLMLYRTAKDLYANGTIPLEAAKAIAKSGLDNIDIADESPF